ncbi:hypothetical protein VaNZ11_013072 [Volvox africanus]|uniref:CW-type domain-containing protein n=1 Tax=Volvox africanus TaxID=51714 RepID=A0ABQ5SGF2_9CHLO|nr:hypothetical protein VaNZ11_013072 [Volvox africanus]
MSAASPANATFFISGISHCELRTGQQLSLEHLRSLQQQLAEQAGRARTIQQQLQQQATQQGLRPGGVAVKAEPGAVAAVKKEEDAASAAQPTPPQAQQTQLQYAALLALQLQQQQQARAAAAAAQAHQQQAQAAVHPALTGAPAALAQNAFVQQGMAPAANAKAPAASAHVKQTRGRQGAGGPAGLPQHSAGATGGGPGGLHQAKPGKVVKDGEEEDAATDQWVQCSKCQTWRQVPDEFWPDIANADEDEDWMCKDALWDVEDYQPNTPACC